VSAAATPDSAPLIGSSPNGLLDAIFSTSPDAIVVVDAAGTIVLASPSVTALFGYEPEDLVGSSIQTLLPADRRAAHEGHLSRYFAEPRPRQMGAGLQLEGRRLAGEAFPVDVSLAPVELGGRTYVAAFVRDAAEQLRAVNRLHAVNDVTKRLLGGATPDVVFQDVASTARALSRSDASWIVLPDDDGLQIAYADGQGTEVLVGETLSAASSRSANVMRTGASVQIDDLSTAANVPPQCAALDLGPGLYAPLVAEDRRLGALVLGRVHGSAPYSALDVAFAEAFATSIAAAVVLAESRVELDRLGIVAEDERIARDLHDTVIQQLFALGMSLEATRAGLDGPAGERLDDAVDRLDVVIRDIRTTIFRLPAQARGEGGLREAVLQCVDDRREQLGFAPRLAFDGPVDTAVPDAIAAHVVNVVGEALSNVARHAGASFAEVVVAVRDETLEVFVVDDGKGIEGEPSAGSGLRNISTRARELGGTAAFLPRDPRGTVLQWRVPLGDLAAHPAD
jgi:PAS domain S-box-containing protein